MAEATRRAWNWFGTPKAVIVVTIGMLIYAVLIGGLFAGYVRVQGCQAEYAEKSARATNARAEIAAEDRRLDLSDRAAADRVEAARKAYDDAWSAVVDGIIAKVDEDEGRPIIAHYLTAKETLKRVQADAAKVRDENAKTRADNEKQRKQNPPPPPPSETC